MENKKKLVAALIFSIALVLSTGVAVDTSMQDAGTTILTVDGSGGADYTNIQAAIDVAHAGDIIEVKAGTYSECVSVDKTLKLVGVIRAGSTPVITAAGFNNSAITINVDGCTIEGFRIIGADGAGITVNSDNNIIKSNVIFGNDIGLEVPGCDNRIFNNYLDNARNAEGSGSNYWNTSMEAGTNIVGNPYLGGNYWSDYAGEDTNGDGIGDIPYQGDALPLVLSAATSIDTFIHSSNPPPEEVMPAPYEVPVDTKLAIDTEVETRLPRQIPQQQEKIIDEPVTIVTAPPSSITGDERILVDQLREAKTVGDMEEAIRIEEELAKIRGQPLEYVAPAPMSEGDGPQGGPVSSEESEIGVKWVGYDILVAGTNHSEIRPSMASDKDGNLYVAVEHADDNYTRVYKSTNGGKSWYYWYWFWDAGDVETPSLAIGDGGGINNRWLFLAYVSQGKRIRVFRVNLSDNLWDNKVIEYNALGVSNPSIVTDCAEWSGWYPYIIYNTRAVDNWVLRFSRSFDYGGNWTTPTTIAGYCGYPDNFYNANYAHPDIDYGSRNLYVAFDNYPPPCTTTSRDIFVMNSTNYGGSWNSAVRLTTSSDDEYDPAVAAAKDDTTNKTAVVAYTRFWNSLDRDVRYAYTRNGGATWYTSYCLACTYDNEKSPELTTSNYKGAIHAAYWHDYDIDYAFADYLTPYWWTKVKRINNMNRASSVYSRPGIVTNPLKPISAEAGITWTDYRNTGMSYDIYFDAPTLPVGCGCYDHDTSTWIYPPSTGDWNIHHHIECNCTTITLNGNLNIDDTLEFNDDVRLRMNCTDNGEYGINVNNGGAFYINESTITNGEVWNANYTFQVYDGSQFKLLGSEVNHAGYAWNLDTAGDNYNDAGLWINTDDTIIDNSVIAYNSFVGVIFYESDNHNVTNSYIHDNIWDGIYMKSSSGNYFEHNWIARNGQDGVYMDSSSGNYFVDNYIYRNDDDGVDARTSPYNYFVEDNDIWSNGDDGIVASNSDNLEITGNYISSNSEGIVLSSCDYCTVAGNELYGNRWYGIRLSSNSQHNTLDNNLVMYTTEEAASAGIYLSHSTKNVITNNDANSNLRGIQLWHSGNATVYNNIANENGGSGISLEHSDYSLVEQNTAINNSAGISLSSTDYTELYDNHVWDNHRGISLSGSTQNTLTKNFAQDNDFGVSLMWSSNDNTIENNDLKSNHNYGIYLFKSNDNGIYVNDMDYSDSIGVYLEQSHGNEIIENTARSSGNYGIDLFNSDRNAIIDNNVTDSTNIGIELSSSDFTNIIHNTAEGSNRGISLRWSLDNNLTDNNANENNIGIYMFQSHRNNVFDNRVNDNGNNGLELSISNDNTIFNNSACNNPNYGIHAYSSKRNSIESNIADYNGLGIFLDWSGNNDIIDNTANDNDINGITLDWSSNDNQVLNNDALSNDNISIQVSHSSDNLLQDNTATDSAIGIFLDWSPDNQIWHNDISNNLYHGITLEWFSDRNEISENDAYGNIVGISLQRSSDNSIEGNNASDCNVSINLEWSSDGNMIQDNQANDNQYYGIALGWSSNDNEIAGNTANNSKKGLYFDEHSTGNTVYNNVFCNNSEYDIDDDDSNTGDDNRCALTDNWNDMGTVGCTYVCQPYDHIRIVPSGPLTMIAGETQHFTAYACDVGDNIIGPVSVTWSVAGGIGTVNPPIGPSTNFTAVNAGTGSVHADDGKGHTADVEILVFEASIPDVTACDVSGTAKNFFGATDDVYCYGYTLAANKDVDIYIVNDGNWSAGDVIPGDVSGGKETVTTDANGAIPLTLIWTAGITIGQYDIIVDVDQNGYVDSDEPIDDNLEVGFEVVPTVISTDATGTEKNAYTSGDNVYAKATDLAPDTTYTIWIQPEPVLEGEILDVSKDPSGSQEVVMTDSSGNLSNTLIWSNVPPGPVWDVEYDIVIDRTGDGEGMYKSAQDGLDDIESWGFIAPTVVPAKPDLEITEKWVNWPECSQPDIDCTICYNVTNTGNETASAGHNTTLYVDNVEVALDYVPEELAPGENYTGCFDDYIWTYTPPTDNITVCADCNNTIVESNETNNCRTNTWMCGDVNEDGTVNVLDVLGVYRRALDPNYPLTVPWAGDVNGDGTINVLDVLGVYRRALDPNYDLNCCCE